MYIRYLFVYILYKNTKKKSLKFHLSRYKNHHAKHFRNIFELGVIPYNQTNSKRFAFRFVNFFSSVKFDFRTHTIPKIFEVWFSE